MTIQLFISLCDCRTANPIAFTAVTSLKKERLKIWVWRSRISSLWSLARLLRNPFTFPNGSTRRGPSAWSGWPLAQALWDGGRDMGLLVSLKPPLSSSNHCESNICFQNSTVASSEVMSATLYLISLPTVSLEWTLLNMKQFGMLCTGAPWTLRAGEPSWLV